MVSLYDYADILNLTLEVTRYDNQNSRWSARIEHAEVVQEGGILWSAYGNGRTPTDALEDYIGKIEGKRLVLHAMSKDLRREFTVPRDLFIPEEPPDADD